MAEPNMLERIYSYLSLGIPNAGASFQGTLLDRLARLRAEGMGQHTFNEPGHPNADVTLGQPDPTLPTPPLPPGASVAGSGRASPVVTPGTSTANTEGAPTAGGANTASSPDAVPARGGRDINDQLANFGFAMAASRNPSIFGQIGEAGLALQRGNREDRQDTRQEREVDVMQEYRRAQIRVAEAEAELARDPNSPINVARLMQARAAMISAQRAGAGGRGGGGSFTALENPDTGAMTFFNPRTGAAVPAPEGFGRPGNASREDTLYQRDITAFGAMNRNNPRYMTDPGALMQDAETWANRRRAERARNPAANATGPAPDVGAAPNVTVVPYRRPGT